jgi:hypothetical protein
VRTTKAKGKVLEALQHVNKLYPKVYMVTFDGEGSWAYQHKDEYLPSLPGVDVGILEDAANSSDYNTTNLYTL